MTSTEGVADASVLLAAMLGEIDEYETTRWLARSCISAVNLSEAVAKLAERDVPREDIMGSLAELELDVRPFDAALAERAGFLRPETRAFGLSFADRACLALAAELDRPAITADRAWAELDLGISIEVIR